MPLNPEAKQKADELLQYAQSQGITSQKELANFMGQMQHESKNFSSMEESFHYSGTRLYEVFAGRNGMDSVAKADEIVKGTPKEIANAMYGGGDGKHSLGNTEPDDGWNFRGRGYVQLTGRRNYARVGRELGLDLVNHPDLVSTPGVAAKAAVQYWKDNVVSKNVQEDVDLTAHAINTASEGLASRRAAAAAWESKLAQGYKPGDPEPISSRTLKQGMLGEDVRHAQDELHTLGYLSDTPDSRFGALTKTAVEAFQRSEGLQIDGKIGPSTQQHLNAASRDKQLSDLTAGVSLWRTFSDPRHPQNALYNTLKDHLPPGTSEERLMQGTAACYKMGITKPDHLSCIVIGDKSVMFDTSSLLTSPAYMDISQPAPSIQQTMQQVQQYDQQQAQIQAQVQQANQQANMQQR